MFCPITKNDCLEYDCEWSMVTDKDEVMCAVTVIAAELNRISEREEKFDY